MKPQPLGYQFNVLNNKPLLYPIGHALYPKNDKINSMKKQEIIGKLCVLALMWKKTLSPYNQLGQLSKVESSHRYAFPLKTPIGQKLTNHPLVWFPSFEPMHILEKVKV